MSQRTLHLRVTAFALLVCGAHAGTDWPDYRGPSCDGHVIAQDLPLTWGEQDNVTWKTAIHGRGWSTPVIADGRLWLTTATDDGRQLFAICVDQASGDIVHDRLLFSVDKPEPRHELNSYASPSPVIGDGRVFVHFGTYGTACLDAASGEVLWQRRDLTVDHIVGPGSSPLLHDDLLIFHQDGGDVQYVIALAADTGETRWRTDRSVDFGTLEPDYRKAYDTPIAIDQDGRALLVCVGAEATMALDAATGGEVWQARYRGFSMSSRPVAGNGLVYVTTGFMTPSMLAIACGGTGDVTASHIRWTCKSSVPNQTSPILEGGRIYFISEGGIVSCLDATTGEQLGRRRLPGEYSASPIISGNRLYFPNREGLCTVLDADPELGVLAENTLEDGFMASPAVAGRALFLRSKTHLYRIEAKATSSDV